MRLQTGKSERTNPLDTFMTPEQLVRKKFKSALPRTILNRVISKFEAMAKTMDLIDGFQDAMKGAGLNPRDVRAGLVYVLPNVKDVVHTLWLPLNAQDVGSWVDRVVGIKDPVLFLGLLFYQRDREAKAEKEHTAFLWPFMAGPEAEKHLLAARNFFVKGGHKTQDN